MHLKLLFKPLTHPLARGEKYQQIELKSTQGEFAKERENQGEIVSKKKSE